MNNEAPSWVLLNQQNTSQSLATFFPLIETLTLPSSLQPYLIPITEEVRWLLHTSMIMGRRRKTVTSFAFFVLYGIERLIDSKRIPFHNIYDYCAFYGIKRDNYHGAKYTFKKYLVKYQQKN